MNALNRIVAELDDLAAWAYHAGYARPGSYYAMELWAVTSRLRAVQKDGQRERRPKQPVVRAAKVKR